MSKRRYKEEGFPIQDFFAGIDYTKYLQVHKIVESDPTIQLPQILTTKHTNGYFVYSILLRKGKRKVVHIYTANQCPPTRAFWKLGQDFGETKLESIPSWQMRLSRWISENDTQRLETLNFGPFRMDDWKLLLDAEYDVQRRIKNKFPTLEELRKLNVVFKSNPSFEKYLNKMEM